MGILKYLGVLSPAHINLFSFGSGGKLMGEDMYGNKYYAAKPRAGYYRERRWVMYKGEPDASSVPPEWHGWLHHQSDDFPSNDTQSYRRPWQASHQANMTGTDHAYRPPGHILEGGVRDKATGDYEAWSPND
jgi:NADH:ubiquinone oxidoreductase subunit